MRRIAIITHFYSRTRGGIATFANDLKRELSNYHEVKVFSKDIDKPINIIKGLLEFKPEVIFINGTWQNLLRGLSLKLLSIRKVRLIYIFHTYPIKKFTVFKKHLFELLICFVSKVVFVSHFCKDEVNSFIRINNRKQLVIFNGISSGRKAICSHSINLTNKKNIDLLAISNFSYENKVRGICLLIDVLKEIPNYNLTILGDGPYIKMITDKIEDTNLKDRVLIMGSVQDVNDYYSKADLFIHITYQDSFPLVILEAMIHDLPIIASRIGGIPEMFNGLDQFTTNNEIKDIKNALSFWISERREINYFPILSRFSWENTIQAYNSIINDEKNSNKCL